MSSDPAVPEGGIRARPESFRARALAASLTVRDLRQSLAWYRDVAGFSVEREYGPEGNARAIALRAGTVEILVVQDDGARGLDRVKGEGLSLQFTTAQNIDELANQIKERGGALESEPADIFGARAFRLKDPDGFRLVFSSER
ncbi:MAG: VOC family protein [Gemmatimonadales bacterium]